MNQRRLRFRYQRLFKCHHRIHESVIKCTKMSEKNKILNKHPEFVWDKHKEKLQFSHRSIVQFGRQYDFHTVRCLTYDCAASESHSLPPLRKLDRPLIDSVHQTPQ